MPFDPILLAVQTDHDVISAGAGISTVTIPLSHCPTTTRVCAVEAELTDCTYAGRGVREFAFSVVVDCEDGTEPPFATQDRVMAAPYIPPKVRPYVMPTICHALRALVRDSWPGYVYRVAKEIRANDKALKKHLLLTDELLGLGYAVEDGGTDPWGRAFWLMERRA